MSKASVPELDLLHGLLAKEFMKRIKDGTATAADLAQARQFLKDNGIEAVAVPGSPLAGLAGSLPFPLAGPDPDDEYTSH